MPARASFRPDLPVTNVQKVLFPGNGFTKGDMLRYYWEIADALLPHLRRRPVTLVRWPDGVASESFYAKNAPSHTPDWVKTVPVARSDDGEEPIDYIVIDDARTLLWVANLGSIELHPFLHRFPKIESPTQIAFDLDPGEGTNLLHCIEVAQLLRDALARLDLECWPKVTGSKGLQLYVPLNTPVTYAATNPFAHSLAQFLEREHPHLIVSNMAKALRRGKVLIDWSQNHEKKTTVAAYSLRGKRDVPYVSTPVTWTELERAHTRRDPQALFFTPDDVVARVRKHGDLFAAVLERKQKLPREFLARAGATSRAPRATSRGVRGRSASRRVTSRNTSRRTSRSRRS